MKIAVSQITIPANYVLVLPDAEHDTFHSKGEASFKTGKVDLEHAGSHYAIRGKVFAVPEKLNFNLPQIRKQQVQMVPGLNSDQMAFYFRSNFQEIIHQKMTSVLFDVDMDLRVNDVVFFNYQEHYNCYAEGRWVETDMGEMMLMSYDNLICSHSADKESELVMLNGFVLVEPISIESAFGTNVYKKAGLFISHRKQDIDVIKNKISVGYVKHWGKHCRGFIEMPDNKESPYEFGDGDVVIYNPKLTPPMEYGLHKAHFGGKQLVKMKRRDIFCILPAAYMADAKTIVSDYNMN